MNIRKIKFHSNKTNKDFEQTVDSNGDIKRVLCGSCCEKEGITNPSYARRKGLHLRYENGRVFCPNCGTEYKVIKTPEQYEEEAKAAEEKRNIERLENLHVAFTGKDMSTGIEFYSLSARVDYDTVWPRIKKFFRFYRSGWSNNCDTDFEMYGFEPAGWLTTEPEKVEAVLVKMGVMKEKNTLKSKAEAEAKAQAEKRAKAEAQAKLKDEIDSQFRNKANPKYREALKNHKEKVKEQENLRREVELEFYNPKSERVKEINDEIIEEIQDDIHTYFISKNNIYISLISKEGYYKIDYSQKLMSKIREIVKKIKPITEQKIIKNPNIETPIIDEKTHTIEEYGDEILERHEDPKSILNLHGGGCEYIICKEHIWKLIYNGSDGDDWGLNNVSTGGAGAIGVRISHNEEVANKIRKYCKGDYNDR